MDGGNGVWAKDLAQHRDLYCQIALLDHKARPRCVEQLVFVDDAITALDQRLQQVERPGAERSVVALAKQSTRRAPKLESTEANRVRMVFCGRVHSSLVTRMAQVERSCGGARSGAGSRRSVAGRSLLQKDRRDVIVFLQVASRFAG